jgi:uncharacterized protein (TIGR03437 family)
MLALCCLPAGALFAGTFGTVVPVGGQPADIALDEGRGVVYVANYTANRIDVVSIATKKIQTSINVPAQPASLSLSPDGRYLVIAHLSNFTAPQSAANALTVMDLQQNSTQTFAFGSAPMGVAFGYDGLALVVTATDFLLLDPATGAMQTLTTVDGIVPKTLPQPTPANPREIIQASVGTSRDLSTAWGTIELGGQDDLELIFRYDAVYKQVFLAAWTSTPILGPRVVSVNKTGSYCLTGWALYHQRGFLQAQFPDALGKFGIGSHAFDPTQNIVYAQVPDSTWTSATPPILQVLDADNLGVREKLRLQENLSGRSIINAKGDVMYATSESGLTILPIGMLSKTPRVVAQQEDLIFQGQWCNRNVLTQDLNIVDPGGNNTDFLLTSDNPAITLSQYSGMTPAVVHVSLDMNGFQSYKGTLTAHLTISTGAGVNVPPLVRVLVNNREPEQRGTILNVPGTIVDLAADPARNRFYVLRQDKNQVLVFDATTYKQIATLRTGNTPWSLAITHDKKFLLIGADNSQVAWVYNLDTLQPYNMIVFPFGHYPRSIAASGRAVLAACRVAGPIHMIDRIQIIDGIATTLPSLGVWKNDIDPDTMLTASPSGSKIFGASANGTVLLYDANADTFVVARQDYKALAGSVAALADDTFIVQDKVLGASLVQARTLETTSGVPSGFALVDGLGVRTTAPTSSSPGTIERYDFVTGSTIRPTSLTEAPILVNSTTQTVPGQCQVVFGQTLCQPDTTATVIVGSAFTRTLAPLPNRSAIVSLSTSGLTLLAWNYDAATVAPQITSIASAADQTSPVAPGGLFTIGGLSLSPINLATNTVPLPTALGDSCMTINGSLVPMVFVSPTQINGQIPFEISGAATMILRTPGGVSNSFQFNVLDNAPSVFPVEVKNLGSQPAVIRASNGEVVTPANPVHPQDWVIIYATGLGGVSPVVKSGYPGPADPLAQASTQPQVTLGGTVLNVGYAGLAPGQVGVYQINVQLPFKGVPTGMSVPLKIQQGDYTATIDVRVVNP